MSNGPEVWIRQGYDLALAGELVPAAIGAYVGSWMQIGHDLAGRLADNQIEEVGTVDPMPLPAWPELAQQAIEENQNMGLRHPSDIPAALKALAGEAQRQAEEAAEHTAALVRQRNTERQARDEAEQKLAAAMARIDELQAQIVEIESEAKGADDARAELRSALYRAEDLAKILTNERDHARRALREEIEANRQLRADYDAAMEQITGDPASDMIADLTSRPGSPRAIFYRVAGNLDATTVEITSPTGHVYAGAGGRTPAAALQEAIQRYERTRRGDNGRRIRDPYDHPDAGQEAEEW